MNKKYNIKKLCILKVNIITKIDIVDIGIHDYYGYECPELLIARIDKYQNYYELFTNVRINPIILDVGDFSIKEKYVLTSLLMPNEIITGKITKSRLIEIYNQINKKEEKKQEISVKTKERK